MKRNTFPMLALLLAVFSFSGSLSVKASHNSTAAALGDRTIAYETYNEKDKELTNLQNEDKFLSLKIQYLNAEWSSEVEDISENVLTALGWNRASLIAAGVNMLKDAYDGASLYDQLTPLRSQREGMRPRIVHLMAEVPNLKTAWESAKTHHEWHISQDQGEEDPGTGDGPGDCGHYYSSRDALQHGLFDELCEVHSWYRCREPSNLAKHRTLALTCPAHKKYQCQGEVSESESARHEWKKLPCNRHFGYKCTASSFHTDAVTCPTENGKVCLSAGSYYACSHEHTYPADQKQACGHTYDPNSSSAHEHRHKTYQCDIHAGYACQESSDHKTHISSCSETKNGQTCNNSWGYYECSPHTHNYPSAPSPPTPTTLCPANGWTNCGSTTSHAKECGRGDTYYTCNPSAVASHGDKSCRRAGCSNNWSNCQSAPWCDAWQGNKCWAE